MSQQIDQLEVYMKMIMAMDTGNSTKVKKADRLVRRALTDNRKRDVNRCIFELSSEEIGFLKKLHR